MRQLANIKFSAICFKNQYQKKKKKKNQYHIIRKQTEIED